MKHTWKSGPAAALALSAMLTVTLAPASALAKSDKVKEHGNAHAGPPLHADDRDIGGAILDASIAVGFGSREADIIRSYFGAHPDPAQPLPPGIAKNLRRGKPLPPGIAKRYLPSGLDAQLPVRDGYERLLAGGDVLLVQAATGIVVDILSNIR